MPNPMPRRRRSMIVALLLWMVVAPCGGWAQTSTIQVRKETKVTAADVSYGQFGYAVALSGDTAVVGAVSAIFVPGDPGAARRGQAYVVNLKEAVPVARLLLPTAPPFFFGQAVAISGDTIVVGAERAAYVFAREVINSVETWNLQQVLTVPSAAFSFGEKVAISGDTVMVGEPGRGPSAGGVFVFTRSGTSWSAGVPLPFNDRTPGRSIGAGFGSAIALDGDTAIIGAPGANYDIVNGSKGAAYIYARKGQAWEEQAFLARNDTALLGRAVGVSGNTAVIGSLFVAGSAYVATRTGTTWSAPVVLPLPGGADPSGRFGAAVAIAGPTMIVGAPSEDDDVGSVYVFQQNNGAWEATKRLVASDLPPGFGAQGAFGGAVAVSRETILIGAPEAKVGTNPYQGAAYLYVPLDSDGDGLPDEWETNGVTIDGVPIDLKSMGANPKHKDLFVHVDWMAPDAAKPKVVLKPSPRAIKLVVDAFARSPLTNPDKKTGVNLHVDLGPDSIMKPGGTSGVKWGTLSKAKQVPFQAELGSLDIDTGDYSWIDFDAIKAPSFGASHRRSVFRYALFASHLAGLEISGLARRGTGDFAVALGRRTSTPGGTIMEQAGTFMHELGHSVGLRHGGGDPITFKPNYLSIMNYRFQFPGVLAPGGKKRIVDYSRRALPSLDESDLDESVGISDSDMHPTFWNTLTAPDVTNKCLLNPRTYPMALPSPALDWNCDGMTTPGRAHGDLNGDSTCVKRGTDGILTTMPEGDDEIRGLGTDSIVAGANGQCETTADPRDEQSAPVGYIAQDVLTGFDDWSALNFSGGGVIGAGAVDTSPMSTTADELPVATILESVLAGLLEEELVAPLDVVTVSTVEGHAPLLVHFDGSGSTAVSGSIVTWQWDFGDGTTGSGAMTDHTYTLVGTYFASLSVTDSLGRENLVPLQQQIDVTDPTIPTPTPEPTSTPMLSATNLRPYQPAGWSGALVVSKVAATHTDGVALTASDTLYVDYAILNEGTATTVPFLVKLNVDGGTVHTSTVNPPLNPFNGVIVEDIAIGALGAGQHTVELVIDSGGAVTESNEADNQQSKPIIVLPGSTTPTRTPTPVPTATVQPGATLVVSTVGNTGNDANPTTGSLRAAIRTANLTPNVGGNPDLITFAIPEAGVRTIKPPIALPGIIDPVIIDGFSQPGASPNTLAVGNNAVVLVEIDSEDIPPTGGGFSIGFGLGGIGGSTVRGVVINRFRNGGIIIRSGGNVVEGCFIGTNAAGDTVLPYTGPNGDGTGVSGITIDQGAGNRIGGTSAAARNVIADLGASIRVGNGGFRAAPTNSVIQGNYLGTNAAGSAALNVGLTSGAGVDVLGAGSTVIGGTEAGAGNLISGNGAVGYGLGISIQPYNEPSVGEVTIQGNLIGTNAQGTAAIGNPEGGIYATGTVARLLIGGPQPGARNIISGNGRDGLTGQSVLSAGIELHVAAPNGVTVQGNFIGTGSDGVTAIPNRIYGISISLFPNTIYTIGGTNAGEGNVIAGNASHGIQVTDGPGGPVAMLRNSMFANGGLSIFGGGLGIDLQGFPENGFNVTGNDGCDGDTGPNGLQNYPELATADSSAAGTSIVGALGSTASTAFRVEFFSSPSCDGSGKGEGRTFLGAKTVTTAADCNGAFTAVFQPAVAVGQFITATATDPGQNTSEFSNCVPVTGTGPVPTFTSGSTPMVTPTSGGATPAVTPSPTGPVPTRTPAPENCYDCLDNDDDGAVDRDDPECPQRANGMQLGLSRPGKGAKTIVKCAKTLGKVGLKFATARLKHLQKCLSAEFACVQQKPNDDACAIKAQKTCTKELGKAAGDESKLRTAVVKACASPAVDLADLRSVAGIGYDTELAVCAERGVATLTSASEVADCLIAQHKCRVGDLVASEVPRAVELLRRAARDPDVEFPCLVVGADGVSGDLGTVKGKLAVKCQKGIGKAGAKFASVKAKLTQKCVSAVYACVQVKPTDPKCRPKATATCAKQLAKLTAPGTGAGAKLAAAIAKGCTKAPFAFADLLDGGGLGFGTRAGECAALGVPSLASSADLAACLERQHACRVEQMLETEMPRVEELLQPEGN